jgi:hypothetical protein
MSIPLPLHSPPSVYIYRLHVFYVPSRIVNTGPLHILWPHRWEHDKDPQLFFEIILKLKTDGVKFHLSVLGEQFSEVPAIFEAGED